MKRKIKVNDRVINLGLLPTFTGQKNCFFFYLTTLKFIILCSVSERKMLKNLKTRPSYLEKTYFQITLINKASVIILSKGESPGEIFTQKLISHTPYSKMAATQDGLGRVA